jgi:uncharacterized repeat protein (TIGR03809 family)
MFMTLRTDVARGRDLLSRWCALAETRLEYLTEMFESGRWRRYYSEVAFLEDIREARVAVDVWRGLSTPEAAAVMGPSPIEISWSGPARAARMRKVEPFAAAVAIEPQAKLSSWGDAESSLSDEAPAVDMAALEQALDNPQALDPAALDPAALDLAAIEQRYPLLRNTF